MDLVVCELARRGKLLVGDPFFEGGVPLVVDRKGAGDVAIGDLVVLRSGRGRARVERVLGKPSAIETVLEGLLWHLGVRRKPAPLPPEPAWDEPERVDLRDLHALTIDPETAKDFDDALSLRTEGDGLRVWVHIADVSAYVPVGSPLDRDASERAFSTYIPGTVEPMLPSELSDDRCSLRPDVERRCVTVEIPFDGDLRAGEPLFYRSLIRSRARLTYSQAEAILAGSEKADDTTTETLRLADRITTELRRRRFARGALQIETGETSFEFDGEGGIKRAWRESEPTSHRLVEELMILANEAVGAFLASRQSAALFRVHERPEPMSVELLLAKLDDLEVPTPPAPERLDPTSASRLAAEAALRATEYAEQSGRGREAFPTLVLRALKQARYDPRNLGHSGLASTAYAHFTSPIRRYPDLVVHRALLTELGLGERRGRRSRHARGLDVDPRARGGAGRVPRGCDLRGVVPGAPALRARLGRVVRRRDHRRDRLGHLHPLRRGLRGLPPGAAPARRVLRAEPARDRARGDEDRQALPPRRSHLGARRIDRSRRG